MGEKKVVKIRIVLFKQRKLLFKQVTEQTLGFGTSLCKKFAGNLHYSVRKSKSHKLLCILLRARKSKSQYCAWMKLF